MGEVAVSDRMRTLKTKRRRTSAGLYVDFRVGNQWDWSAVRPVSSALQEGSRAGKSLLLAREPQRVHLFSPLPDRW
jgi:hypothetical protein